MLYLCDRSTTHLWAHVFGECPRWTAQRSSIFNVAPTLSELRSWDFMYTAVAADPVHVAYCALVKMVSAIVCEAELFWKLDKREK